MTRAAKIWPAWVPLEGEAAEEAATTQRRVLHDHRARAGDLTGDREALDEAQRDEQRRSEEADLLVRRQERDEERRDTHEEHAQDEHVLAAVLVAPGAEDERADRAGDIADDVGAEGADDGHPRVALVEEDRREDEGGGLGVDEEVVVLQGTADPAAGRGLPGLATRLCRR